MRFTIIEDEIVVLCSKGVFKQVSLYTREVDREDQVYAKHGAGYIRLQKDGVTSVPAIRWEFIEIKPSYGIHGRMIYNRSKRKR